MLKAPSTPLVFRKQDSIGINDAEDDEEYLLNCFIDIGDYELIKDFESKRCLILGRTGTGKTALLTKLKNDKGDRVITIKPEALAMQHISNSTIIRYMHDLDIDLNTFFKLLWRHVICVEIFQHHFKVVNDSEGEDILDRLRARFKKENTHHYRALHYLQQWRHSFWKDTDSHVTEMITKTEEALEGSLKSGLPGASGKITSGGKATEEEKVVVRKLAQEVVNDLQMREVIDLLDMLNEVVEDRQKQYYLVIDKLDEGWVDDALRYRLIKALLETVRDLNRVKNVKPIVVLRIDLLEKVFNLTHDTGFQGEKYKSLYLQLRWTRPQLIDLIDTRLDYLLRARYSKQRVITHKDVLPAKVKSQDAIDYILDRTRLRQHTKGRL